MIKQKLIVLGSAALTFSIMVLGFYLGTMQDISDTTSRLIAIGRWMGIVTTFSILIEILLMARLPIIEKSFDIDEINDFHRLNGYVILGALVAHIIFLTVGYSQFFDIPYVQQFINLNTGFEDVLLATIGSIIFFIIAFSSIKIARRKVRYEVWYYVHLTVYFAIALTFLHQISSGSDMLTQTWYRYYWIGLYALVLGLLGYYRFLRPFVYMLRYDLRVSSVVKEANSIYSIYLSGRNLSKFKFAAGQYGTWRFLARGYWAEAHPFSISSKPGSSTLRLTFKSISGDYSTSLVSIPIGTKVLLDGPRGAFSPNRIKTNDVIIVAGGIGAVPMISMLEQIAKSSHAITFVYSVTHLADIAFLEEIQQLTKTYQNIRFVPFESSKHGRITKNHLTALIAADVSTTSALICGPNAMTDAVRTHLLHIGLPKNHIITEQFNF